MGDPLYTLGVLRRSSVGLIEVMAGVGGSGWKGKEGNRFPVWATRVGEGGVGMRGSTVAIENWFDKSSVNSSEEEDGRWRSWGVLVDSWEDDSSSSSSEWVSESGSRVLVVLQKRGLSQGGQGGWEMFEIERHYLIVGLEGS